MTESDYLAVGTLTQILSRLVKERDAANLWQLYKRTPPKPFHDKLLAKLANFPSIVREVKDALFVAFLEGSYKPGDLDYISGVADPRIDRWFER